MMAVGEHEKEKRKEEVKVGKPRQGVGMNQKRKVCPQVVGWPVKCGQVGARGVAVVEGCSQ